MTDYAGYVFPLPEFYQQDLTGSLDDGLDRWSSYELYERAHDVPVFTTLGARAAVPLPNRDHAGYVFPEWSSNLFGHILVVPSRLALGNVLTNQTRTIEIANLFLTTQQWLDMISGVEGLSFPNLPPELLSSATGSFGDSYGDSYGIPSFGSFMLEVGISAEGPSTIIGDITLVFNAETVVVPVTGRRVIAFQFQPLSPVKEELEWKTDVLTAEDGTEQRLALRYGARQIIRYDVMPTDKRSQRRIDALLFDWLDKVFAVPLWFEARLLNAPVNAGALTLPVQTDSADFRVGELCLVYASAEVFDIVQIATLSASQITLDSEVLNSYGTDATVMPIRTAYAKTVPRAARLNHKHTRYSIEFVTLNNIELPSTAGASTYDSRVLLDDCNHIDSATENSWARDVIVLDAETGRVFQSSHWDRSKLYTSKIWELTTRADVWRVRRLLHHFRGNQRSFWLPTFDNDMQLTQQIGASALTFRVEATGMTAHVAGRRPFGDVRLVLKNGTAIVRRVTGVETDGDEEVVSIASTFSTSAIPVANVERIEWCRLVRISDDRATFLHRYLGNARVEIKLITVKE